MKTLATAMTAAALLLAGCAAPTEGTAIPVADATEQVDVTVMDTGKYSVVPQEPFGKSGDRGPNSSALAEAHRMASAVVGPWQLDPELRWRGEINKTHLTLPMPTAQQLQGSDLFDEQQAAIAETHGFVTGFTTFRTARGALPVELVNAVLRFPTPEAAAAAATEISSAAAQLPTDGTAREAAPIPGHPEAFANRHLNAAGLDSVQSFSAHGPFMLIQYVRTATGAPITAETRVQSVIDAQIVALDQFQPTPVDQMGELPVDFTDGMLAATLRDGETDVGVTIGAWEPDAWLHFENNPIRAQEVFTATGVDAVTQFIPTVYRARDAEAASELGDWLVDQAADESNDDTIGDVPGLPSAYCVTRAKGAQPPDAAPSWRRIEWKYFCVATADRYAFTVFADTEDDVKQRVSAQYRLLAGE